jgi:outer membrane protein assembly factor BamB
MLDADGLVDKKASNSYIGQSPVCENDSQCNANAKCIGAGFCVCKLDFIGDGKTCERNTGVMANSPWPMEGGNAWHTRQSTFNGSQNSNLKWKFPADGIELGGFTSPVVDGNGNVYAGNDNGTFYIIDDSGNLKNSIKPNRLEEDSQNEQQQQQNEQQQKPMPAQDQTVVFSASAAIGDRYVYMVGEQLYVYDTVSGEINYFRNDEDYWFNSAPTISGDTLYVGNGDGNVYALDLVLRNQLVWKGTTFDDELKSSVAVWSNVLFVQGKSQLLHAWNLTAEEGSRKTQWSAAPKPENVQFDRPTSSPSVAADGTAVYVGNTDSNLYAFDPNNGTLHWKYQTAGPIYSSPAISADKTIYIGSQDGNLYAIKPNGELYWRYYTAGEINSSPVIGADGTVYFASYDGNVYAVKPDGALLWSYSVGSVKTSLVIGKEGTLYVSSDDGHIYAFGGK